LVDGVALPDHGTGVGVERRDVAAERAALVLRLTALTLFAQPLHGHEQLAVVIGWCAGDRRKLVIVDLADPELLAGVGVDRVGVGARVAEDNRLSRSGRVLVGPGGERSPNAGLGLVGPVRASGLRIEC